MDDIFFTSSKVLWGIFQPDSLFFWLLIMGTLLLWTRFSNIGRRVVTVTLILVLVLGAFPVARWLNSPLEKRFPTVRNLPADIDGIVVLGFEFNFRKNIHGQFDLPLNNSGQRLMEALVLMDRFPSAPVFFSGYSGRLFYKGEGEHEMARLFFKSKGADITRIHYEKSARNTYENAINTKNLAAPNLGENWLLVTSARHMPRSMGVFRKIGWDMIPYPVDFLIFDNHKRWIKAPSFLNVLLASDATREWVGLLAYYLTGKTDDFFPAP